jgi:hypothetical protein
MEPKEFFLNRGRDKDFSEEFEQEVDVTNCEEV